MKLNASSPHRSLIWLTAILAFCLIAANVWSISKMLASQSALSEARDELQDNQRLVAEIKRLKDRPRIASLEEEPVTGMLERIQQAMQGAEIPSDSKLASPSFPPDPKGPSYKERRTEIQMVELSMPQIIRFCQLLEVPEKGLTVRGLDLKESKRSKGSPSDLWDATITLSQLIYSAPGASL